MAEETKERELKLKCAHKEVYGVRKIELFCERLTDLMASSGLTVSDIRKSCDFCIDHLVPGGYGKLDIPTPTALMTKSDFPPWERR